jgi:HEAT repeat protein
VGQFLSIQFNRRLAQPIVTRIQTIQRCALLILLALLAGAGLWLALRSHQPSYGGKNLNEWLARLTSNGEEDGEAVNAVRQIGTNAIPVLVRMMGSEDSSMKRTFIAMLRSQHLVNFHILDETEQHLRASFGFNVLGPIAHAAVPELEPLIWKPNISRFAVGALADINEDGLRAALGGLHSTNTFVRRETAGRLGALGIKRFMTDSTPDQLQLLRRQAGIALPPLIVASTDPDELVRARAVIALGLLGQKPEQVVPVLEKLLRNEKGWRVPSAAAKSLGRFGANAVTAIPALKEALKHQDSRVSGAATNALRAIETLSQEALGRPTD